MRIPPDKVPFTTVAITSSALGVHQHPHVYSCSGARFALHPTTESGPCEAGSAFQVPARSRDAASLANTPALPQRQWLVQIP
jgi:hypothetical protein